MNRIEKKLVIITHVRHKKYDGKLFAYTPYVREIDIWADLFTKVIIAGPCKKGNPTRNSDYFTRPNIEIYSVPETGGRGISPKLKQLLSIPLLVYKLLVVIIQADCIQVRCPGNLGLLGVILSPLFSKHLVAKYAGQWSNYPGEPWSFRLQKAILRSKWWGNPVMVYGCWQNQPSHIVSFFTSVLSKDHLLRASKAASQRVTEKPLHLLYVGRLSADKNIDAVLKALSILELKRKRFRFSIVGDGPEKKSLEKLASTLILNEHVHFIGAVPFEQVLCFYEEADILTLISRSEGWPKAITEAMAFGLICVGTDTGVVSSMLGERRGMVIPPGDFIALSGILEEIYDEPDKFREMSRLASIWAQQYSLDDLKKAIYDLLIERWNFN